ncbi:MAG: isoleucine--tRNA ligase [Methanomassiliicoccales archaeon]|nr:isoleucine--tRNA ligase [Methanomassiliicoccales archaeon]MDD1756171.1 isoleucine--tRNA ligase [Methanomassiliicoccales archaeon]
MIKQVQANYNPAELEKRVREHWANAEVYRKTKELRASGPNFYFVDGPPYTTGAIHLGTSWNKTLKDTYIRYRRMQRYNVRDQPGYDMHGLPIEVKVEQSIGVKTKKEIEEYGIDRFVSTCKQFAMDFQKRMTEQFKELGVWMDWDTPYLTITSQYVEAAWWTLKRAYDKELLAPSNRVLSWCPRCETALAEAEIEYRDEKDPSIYVRFPLKDDESTSLLIWTTTPWTLPGNLAVAAHPDLRYAKVRLSSAEGDETVIVLESLVEQVGELGGYEGYEVLDLIEGDDLIGMEYITPFLGDVEYQRQATGKWVHRVIPSSTVAAENTGLVHIAPGHGPEDFELGKEFGLEPFCPVDETGRFTKDLPVRYAGMSVKEANKHIIEELKERKLMYSVGTLTHRYGHCWRCDSGIIYRNTTQWFLKITQIKNLMLEEIEKIHWTPDWAGSSREYDWTVNARDWCISRQRYWGIPLPVWTCQCGETKVVGSITDLESGNGYRKDMELHRPWIDAVTFKCPRCSKQMRRVPDVLDVWFDSGVATWAQLGFPRSRAEFDRWWPCKWITEAHDQTRGWFYSQLAAGCIAFDRAPYEAVLMHGWVLDPNGQPMSKSRGNVIEPEKVIKDYGADALRFYLMRTNAPWEDTSFQWEGVKNARKTLNILWNVVNFATTYMSIDSFEPGSVSLEGLKAALRPEDRWMVSRTEKMKGEVAKFLNSYELHKACRIMEDFVLEDLSRWYVRLIRDRMWSEKGDLDKLAAYKVLHEALLSLTKVMAPFCPHITEEIYQHIDGSLESVHMLDWPGADTTRLDERLDQSMATVQELVDLVTKARQSRNIKLRWPMKRVVVRAANNDSMEVMKQLESVILSQANVKVIEYIPPGQEWGEIVLNAEPNPNAIGKVYRQWASKIAVLLKSRPAKQIRDCIEKGSYSLGIEGQMIKIEPNMVSFTSSLPPDVEGVKFSGGDLYMDFEITQEIEAEGFARELIRRIQQMRKDIKLNVEEYVRVEVKASAKLIEFFRVWHDHIMSETRCRQLEFVDSPKGDHTASWEVEGEKLHVSLTSLHFKQAMDELLTINGLSQDGALALIEAGHRSLTDLRPLSEEQIGNVPGLPKADVKKISHYLERADEAIVPSKDAAKPQGGMAKEALVPFLLRVPRMNQVKADMLYEAGYDSIDKIKAASKEDLRKVKGMGEKTVDEIVAYASKGGFEATIKCEGCGALVPPDKMTCPSCGARVSIESLVEEEDKGGAHKPALAPEAELERSFTYLIKEEKAERSYQLFEKALAKGMKGFCVTRNYPLKIKAKWNLGETPILWLSNVGKESSIRPKDLEKLSVSLEQFLAQSEGGVILLDGLEYLITNNNFLTVLRLVQSLRDQVAINRSILMLVLNPSTLDAHELNLLEKEVDATI